VAARFADKRPLELRHGSDDLKHEAAGGCAEIEVVAEAWGKNRDFLQLPRQTLPKLAGPVR